MPIADPFAALRVGPARISAFAADARAFPPFPPFPRTGERENAIFLCENNGVPLFPALPAKNKRETWEQDSDDLSRKWGLPLDWAKAVVAIRMMDVPRTAVPDRWSTIVADAERITTRYYIEAEPLGWTLADFFGFDPDPKCEWECLAIEARGGDLTFLNDREVVIRSADLCCMYRKQAPADAPMIWTLNRRGHHQNGGDFA